jgi:hypothetical protein
MSRFHHLLNLSMSKLLEPGAEAVLEPRAQMLGAVEELGHIGLDGYQYKAQQWHVLLVQLEQLEQSIQAAPAEQPQLMAHYRLAEELEELARL